MPAFQRWREVERMASWMVGFWRYYHTLARYVAAGNDIASNNLTSIKRLNCRPVPSRPVPSRPVPSRPVRPSSCVCTVNTEPYIMYVLRYRPYVGIVS